MNHRNADRVAAIASGNHKYQGKPCPHGHVGVRYVQNYGCVDCIYDESRRARAARRARA